MFHREVNQGEGSQGTTKDLEKKYNIIHFIIQARSEKNEECQLCHFHGLTKKDMNTLLRTSWMLKWSRVFSQYWDGYDIKRE